MIRFVCRSTAAVLVLITPAMLVADRSRQAGSDLVARQISLPRSVTSARENFRPIRNPVSIVEQFHGLLFNWKPENGGELDFDCFPSEELAALFPEIIQWEIPSRVISGIRHERLSALLVEAVKEIEAQVDDCYRLLHRLAVEFREVQDRVSDHSSCRNVLERLVAELTSHVASQECTIAHLRKKECELGKSVQQLQAELETLKAVVQQLQGGEE